MAWGRIDDRLHSSMKWRRASKGGRALWATSLSWCMDQLTDGHVPRDMIRALDGTPSDAKSLVAAGLWDATDDGWRFHDWAEYQPDAASLKARKNAESEAGTFGNHRRWHVKRKVRVPGCEHCEALPPDRLPDQVPDWVPDDSPIGYSESGANPPKPIPIPNTQSPDLGGEPKQRASEHPQQACGRQHDPADSCGACGAARRRVKDDELAAQRAKAASERKATRAAQEARAREAEAARAEAEADPDQTERAKAAAFAAIRGGSK